MWLWFSLPPFLPLSLSVGSRRHSHSETYREGSPYWAQHGKAWGAGVGWWKAPQDSNQGSEAHVLLQLLIPFGFFSNCHYTALSLCFFTHHLSEVLGRIRALGRTASTWKEHQNGSVETRVPCQTLMIPIIVNSKSLCESRHLHLEKPGSALDSCGLPFLAQTPSRVITMR